jgi:hypothetical protein
MTSRAVSRRPRALRVAALAGLALALAPVADKAAAATALPTRDLVEAPPAFERNGILHVPVDFLEETLALHLDVAAATAVGHATIRFYAAQAGRPLLDLVPEATAVRLNGVEIAAPGLLLVRDPNDVSDLRAVAATVEAGSTNTLEIDYALDPKYVGFADGGVQLGMFMTDLSARGYLERHAPANLPYDRFPLRVTAEITGATSAHRLFANGAVRSLAGNAWEVQYPETFNSQAVYFHLTNRPLQTVEGRYQGTNAVIPFTIYAEQRVLAERALAAMYHVLGELETDYGHFSHEAMLVYVTPTGGGMEYGGATMTSLSAIEHEVFHSWFARSVTHADGNSGWIDEALASWRDAGYPRATSHDLRPATQMAGFPPYRRETATAAYKNGMQLISEVDLAAAGDDGTGGVRPLLRRLFQSRPHAVLSSLEFEAYLEGASGLDLRPLFERYVYGIDAGAQRHREAPPTTADDLGTHPRAYTDAELELYR